MSHGSKRKRTVPSRKRGSRDQQLQKPEVSQEAQNAVTRIRERQEARERQESLKNMTMPFFIIVLAVGAAVVLGFFLKPSPSTDVVASNQPSKSSNAFGEIKSIATSDISPEEAEKERELFRDLNQGWLDAAQRVVAATGNEQAQAVYDFIVDNAAVSFPVPKGVAVVDKPNNNEDVDFLFLLVYVVDYDGVKDDPYWGPTLSVPAAAMFHPVNRQMIIRQSIPCSDTWRSLCFLHEGFHAKEFLERRYNYRNEEILFREEAKAHDFMNDLQEALGGEAYQVALGAEVVRIRKAYKRTGSGLNMSIASPLAYSDYTELESIFGPAVSEEEKLLRATSFWINATFRFFEEDFGTDAQRAKEVLLLNTRMQ